MSKEYKVFVYGTLRKGDVRFGVLEDLEEMGQAKFIREAKTKPLYKLLDLGAFPGLKNGGYTEVVGEMWEIDKYTKQLLDNIEGVPILYQDEPVEIEGEKDVFAYFYQREDRGYKEIKSGDWFKKD
jgi:gamma-glutamylcyclotransferase (GGCT)/AIG2-like uncharacterized protein YtfP